MVFVAILFLLLFVGSVFYYRRKLKFTLVGIASYKSASESKDYRINELRVQVGLIENEVRDKTRIIEESNSYIKELEDSLHKSGEALDEVGSQYEKKLGNMEANNRKLSNDLVMAGRDISDLKDLLAEKDKVNNSLIETNRGLLEKIADMKKQNMSLVSSAGGYEKSNKSLREALEKLRNDHNENVRKYNELAEEYEKVIKECKTSSDETQAADKTDKEAFDEQPSLETPPDPVPMEEEVDEKRKEEIVAEGDTPKEQEEMPGDLKEEEPKPVVPYKTKKKKGKKK